MTMTTTQGKNGLARWLSVAVALAGGCASEVDDGERVQPVAVCAGEDCTPRCLGDACADLTYEAHSEMLGELGVDLEPEPAVDPNGEALAEDHNPLGAQNRELFALDELFIAGMAVSSTGSMARVTLTEDDLAANARLHAAADDTWSAHPTKAVAIDLDGDGIEEIVTVELSQQASGNTLRAHVLDDAGDRYAMASPTTITTFDAPPINNGARWFNGYFQLDAAAADLDGDGSDDLFVAVGPHLLHLRYEDEAFAIVDEELHSDPGGDPAADVYVRLAAGDVTLDGRDELVIVTSGSHGAYDSVAEHRIVSGDLEGEIASGLVQKTVLGTSQLSTASPAIGDIDGDGLPEIVFAGLSTIGHSGALVLVMNGSKHEEPFAMRPLHWQSDVVRPLFGLAIGDLDGDRKDDIFVDDTILRLDPSGDLMPVAENLPLVPATDVVVPGDVTGDHRDDFVFLRGGADPDGTTWVDGYSVVYTDADGAIARRDVAGVADHTEYPTIALANVDRDSSILSFVGRELMFGDPSVIAVVAAPPTFEGSGQGDGETAFGQSESREEESEVSMGFSVEMGVGYEAEDPTGFFGGGFEVSIGAALGWSTSHSRTIERTISFATGPEEDKIVFAAVPFDVYVYDVVSSPNAAAIGSRVAVAIPREPQVLSTSRDFYNSRVRGQVAAIDDRVLTHEIGSPFSYPTRAERDAVVAEGDALYSELATVGVGSGSTTVTVSRTDGVGHGSSRDFSMSLEIQGKVGGVTGRLTAGMSFGVSETVTNTTGTFYEGTVGDIPSDTIDAFGLYRFGLLAYPQTHGGRDLMVVTYWVEE
jgi:hypothetical protein